MKCSRTALRSARTRFSSFWGASRRSATTRNCAARTASGRSRAIRPRARFIRSPPSSGSTGRRSRPPIPASTSSRSNPNIGSWRRCTRRPRAARSCSSRARRRSSSTIATARRTQRASARRSIAPISIRPPTRSPRRASGCWRWRGCPIRASKPGAWVRPICRRPSCCSVLSGLSIRRARRRSRR